MADKSIGRRMAQARRAAGLTQMQVAVAIGSTPTQVSSYERGVQLPGSMAVARYAVATGVTTDWILLGTGPGPRVAA